MIGEDQLGKRKGMDGGRARSARHYDVSVTDQYRSWLRGWVTGRNDLRRGNSKVQPASPCCIKFCRIVFCLVNEFFHLGRSIDSFEPFSHCGWCGTPPVNRDTEVGCIDKV